MTVPELIQVLGVATIFLLVAGTGLTILRWFWKRTDRAADPSGGLDELRTRVAELEAERGRVAELEERLDFAERMLARQSEALHLPKAP